MMKRVDLISEAYCETQRELHAKPEGYGGKGQRWSETIKWLLQRYDAHSVLDYGCGAGTLCGKLRLNGITCREYDPAVKGKDGPPSFADLVVCTDVLEHVEPLMVGNVLKHIQQLSRKAIFVVVSLRDSNKTLSDGRNAHLTVRPEAWWRYKMEEEHWIHVDCPDLPLPPKISRDKHYIAVWEPCR